jgi:prolyl-tRNA synthetase
MRGVPLRLEVGPKDVANNVVMAARRDMGKEGKRSLPQENLAPSVHALLDDIQANLLAQATTFRDANIIDVKTYDDLKQVVEAGGFARGWYAGDSADDKRIKNDTQATHRCFPLEQPGGGGECLLTHKRAEKVALFAKAY